MKYLVLIALLALPATPLARPVCNPDGAQAELNACAAEKLALADADLNRVYRAVLERLADNGLATQRLRNAQRLWIQLRDADIQARYPVPDGGDARMHHGSIYPLLVLTAKAEATRARSAWLRRHFLENEEGQL